MEALRSMIDLLSPRTPSDARFMTEDKIKGLYVSLRFLATFAVNAFYIIDKNSFLHHSKFLPLGHVFSVIRYSIFGFA